MVAGLEVNKKLWSILFFKQPKKKRFKILYWIMKNETHHQNVWPLEAKHTHTSQEKKLYSEVSALNYLPQTHHTWLQNTHLLHFHKFM